ncbi:MAG: hypothetical protein H0U76_23355 [Ktedonobacteraceae bacterium]|nr:hypothetical protein [Ktedonobacteraceae bacterium]
MPKQAEYKIVWSDTLQRYELIHTPFFYPLDSLEYWLTQVSTFHFCAASGDTLTLRRETKQRGGGYWYAYKRVNGKVQKKYIGDTYKVTLSVLEELAYRFTHPVAEEPPPPPPPSPPPPTLLFTKSLQSALSIFAFSTIPDRKALTLRYRELSKQHHPDTGGLHENMVAVNLSYDYLKRFL